MALFRVCVIASAPFIVTSLYGCNGKAIAVYCDVDTDCGAGESCVADHSCIASSGSTSDGGNSDPLTCENYCLLMDMNCQGDNLEYRTHDVCLDICDNYIRLQPSGHYAYPSDTPDGNDSLGCRLWHAHAAQEDPAMHCRNAGPLGGDYCGGPCGPFCQIVLSYCTVDHWVTTGIIQERDGGVYPYEGGISECDWVCGTGDAFSYLRGAGDLVDPNGMMIQSGNTLNCRLWHLETAIEDSQPVPLCLHTAAVSATCR
jgi:hypothetical protein